MITVENEAKAGRRRHILYTAKRVFSEKGFHNASVSDIVDQAGIARGTFYLYFTNKRDIFDNLLDNLLVELDKRIKPVDLSEGSPKPLDQIKDNMRRVLELVVKEPELFQILLHHSAGLDQRSARAVRTFYDHVLRLIERSLDHGIRMGLVRPCRTRIVASCVLGTLKEVANWLTSQEDESPPIDSLVEEVLGYGLGGIFARPVGA